MGHDSGYSISVDQARRILGTSSKELTDDAIGRLIYQLDILSDVIIDVYDGSKINSNIAKSVHDLDT